MSNPGRLLAGVALVVAGILFLLDLGDYINAGEIIGTWWPLVIIGFGVVALTGSARSNFAAIALFAVGGILLIANFDFLPFTAGELFLPVALIAIGAGLLFVRSGMRRDADASQSVNAFAAFGGQEVQSRSGQFRGGSATALFGGVTLDLRNATLDPDGAGIDTFAAFGGVDILVPRGWRINASGMPFFGSFGDSTDREEPVEPGAPTLTVSGVAMFGAVDVKYAKD